MPQIINTNIASLNAQRNLNTSQRDNDVAMQRLSSGLRINSAKDDAAGLAISTRFDSQVRGTSVAVRNAGDGISLAQTAEGSLNAMTASLQRIRELALQSANDTNTDVDREALNAEVQQLIEEIDTVSTNAAFNGKKLLDGTFSNATFQTGANVGESVSFGIAKATVDSLGTGEANGVSSISSTLLVRTASMAGGDLVINGVAVGAANAGADGASTGSQSFSSIANAAAINEVSDLSGVRAVVGPTVAGGTAVASVAAAATVVTINGLAITTSGTGVAGNLAADLQGVAEQINLNSGQTGVVASVDETNLNAGVVLTAEDGRNIVAAGGALVGVGADETYFGTYTLVADDGQDITISSSTGASLENAGIEQGTYSGSNAVAVSDTLGGAALVAGDLVVNGVVVGPTFDSYDNASTATKAGSAIAVAAAINLVGEQAGVTASANTTEVTSGAVTADTGGTAVLNGVSISIAAGTTGTLSEQVSLAVSAINNFSAQSGVRAEAVDDDQYQLIADDGRNIVSGAAVVGLAAATTFGTVSLESGGAIKLSTQTANIDNSGFEVGTFGGGSDGQLLSQVDISTVKGAEQALVAVDNALQSVASQAADLGAIQNRFESTISTLQVTNENLSAANSRIKDADFAAETAALARSQVLQQAGISILAQANARPQQVLSLLQ